MCSRDGVSPQCWRQLLSERVHRRFMGSKMKQRPTSSAEPTSPAQEVLLFCSPGTHPGQQSHGTRRRERGPGRGLSFVGRTSIPPTGRAAACAVSAWSLGWGARGPQGRQLSKYRTWDRAATENKTLREHSAAGSSSRSHPKGSPIPINRNVAW